jgi:chromosome segregation ATPase
MASSSQDDDAMMRKREPMTIDGLKRATDRQFERLRRQMDGAVGRIETELRTLAEQARQQAEQSRQQAEQSRQQAEETRRHFDIVAESMRDDLRIFADAIAGHSERLNQHGTRIDRLERRLV